ncbi:MAG: hypothetical protein ACREPL_11960 [Rhodanobacteraceae bacterium]
MIAFVPERRITERLATWFARTHGSIRTVFDGLTFRNSGFE